MQLKRRHLLWLTPALFAGLWGWTSCETKDQECYEPSLVRTTNRFYYFDTMTEQVVIDTVNGTTITKDSLMIKVYDSLMPAAEMQILDEDSLYTLYGTEAGSNIMRIALNPGKDSTRYTFRVDTLSTTYDTITYYYTPLLHFISNSCGYNYYYTVNDVKFTRNLLDSMRLNDNNVTNDINITNVQLYFKKNF